MRLMNRCGIGPGKLFYPLLHFFNSLVKQNICLCVSSGYKCMDFFLCVFFLKDLDLIRLLSVLHVYNVRGHFFYLTAVKIVFSYMF
jgi:hypothetical protein